MTFQAFPWLDSSNGVLKDLHAIMIKKKSILCVAADVTSCQELLQLADSIGPYICLLKVLAI